MKKHSGFRTILELSLFIVLTFAIGMLSFDLPAWIGFAFLGLLWLGIVYFNWRSRRESKSHELVLFTRNDGAKKITYISLGSLLLIGSLAWIWGFGLTDYTLLYFSLIGALLISAGILYWPELKLSLDSANLKIIPLSKTISLTEFDQISIKSESLEFQNEGKTVYLLSDLYLEEKSISRLKTLFGSSVSVAGIEILESSN